MRHEYEAPAWRARAARDSRNFRRLRNGIGMSSAKAHGRHHRNPCILPHASALPLASPILLLSRELPLPHPTMSDTGKVPTMESFVRKSKPRKTAAAVPPHNVVPAPLALVRATSATAVVRAMPRPAPQPCSSDPTDLPLPSAVPRPVPLLEPTSPTVPTPKPRKRFRKKVNGLFGDHTELKKRMNRLLLNTDSTTTRSTPRGPTDSAAAPAERPVSPILHASPLPKLPPAYAVVERLNAGAMTNAPSSSRTGIALKSSLSPSELLKDQDEKMKEKLLFKCDKVDDDDVKSLRSFDTPAFVATASRAVGSPERLRAISRNMGRLSPRSNARFLEEVLVGSELTPRRVKVTDDGKLTPPHLPSVDSSEFETEKPSPPQDSKFALSPVSVERTGAPAVLRRKVRRLDRGYRSEDVRRARLAGMPLSEIAASPTAQRRGDRPGKWPRARVRRLELDRGLERDHVPRDASTHKRIQVKDKMRIEESQMEVEEDEEDEDAILSSDGAPPKKSRRLRSGAKSNGDGSVDDVEVGTNDGFAMLVKAAAVQQRQSTVSSRSRSRTRKRSTEGTSDKICKRPRKKKRGSSHDVFASLE